MVVGQLLVAPGGLQTQPNNVLMAPYDAYCLPQALDVVAWPAFYAQQAPEAVYLAQVFPDQLAAVAGQEVFLATTAAAPAAAAPAPQQLQLQLQAGGPLQGAAACPALHHPALQAAPQLAVVSLPALAPQQPPPFVPASQRTVFFAGVTPIVTPETLIALFSQFGPVEDLNLFKPWSGSKTSKGCGLAVFCDRAAAAAALEALHGKFTWPGARGPMIMEWMDPSKQHKKARAQPLALPPLHLKVPCGGGGGGGGGLPGQLCFAPAAAAPLQARLFG